LTDLGQSHRSGTYRSSPPIEGVQLEKEEPDSGAEVASAPLSLHPLAALGIATPGRNSKRPTSSAHEHVVQSELTEPSGLSDAVNQSERNTLLGMSAEAVARVFASASPELSKKDLPIASVPLDVVGHDATTTSEPPIERVAPPTRPDNVLESPQQQLEYHEHQAEEVPISTELVRGDKVPESAESSLREPESAAADSIANETETVAIAPSEERIAAPSSSVAELPPSTPSETPEAMPAALEKGVSAEKAPPALIPALGDLERQLLASMGPEFQAKVLSLVADRVAAIVAERMLENLGQSGHKATSPGSPRPARGRRPQSAKSGIGEPEKQKRRKAQ
jgi:hypothetical protein